MGVGRRTSPPMAARPRHTIVTTRSLRCERCHSCAALPLRRHCVATSRSGGEGLGVFGASRLSVVRALSFAPLRNHIPETWGALSPNCTLDHNSWRNWNSRFGRSAFATKLPHDCGSMDVVHIPHPPKATSSMDPQSWGNLVANAKRPKRDIQLYPVLSPPWASGSLHPGFPWVCCGMGRFSGLGRLTRVRRRDCA